MDLIEAILGLTDLLLHSKVIRTGRYNIE